MKKRLLALVMTILTIVSGLPTTVLAAGETYQTGDTFTSDTNPPTGGLPGDIPTGTEWSGPMTGYNCGKEEHTHSVNAGCLAYVIDPNRCEGGGDTDWGHWWHSTDCYAIDASACPGGGTTDNNHRRHTTACYQVEATGTCTLEEHTHSASACGTSYVWTLTETTNTDQHREWWPVYWDFDSQRNNPDAVWDESVVTVTAGGQSIAFSDGEVLSSTALSQAASGTTATIGDVLNGIQITVAPGYFLTEYRLVCGNHTGCGIVTTTTSTGHNAEDYTATVDFSPSAGSLDHWYNIGGMHNDEDENDGVYQPTAAPDPNANDIYHTSGSNTIYPFYLLLKVEKDNAAYSISYDWGDLQGQLSASVPAGEDNMLRNSSHTVKAPGNGATEAAALGYVFTGWKVDATGYDADAIVQPDHTVTVYGGDITLVAQWATAVSYVYTTPVPDGAPEAPASRHYDIGANVTVEGEPTLAGYTFSGWTTDDANVSGDTFTMPATSVVFEGTFTKDDSQTKALYYQVEYYLNGQLQESETVSKTVSVWVNDPNTVTFDKALNKTFTDYELHRSEPIELAHYLTEPEHANDDYVFAASTDPSNPTVLKLYYTGTNADLSIEKAVMDQSGKILTHTDVVKVDDVLTYEITVTNKGNAPMTGVKITDTHNGAGPISFTDTNEIQYANGVFTIANLPVDDPDTANVNEGQVTITYTYEVAQADAGKTLVNYAIWRSDDGSKESTDDAEVKVEEWHTLTIEYYADGVLQSGLTETEDMAAGDNYFVIVPTDITVNGDVYAFDAPATTDSLSGTLTADTTVKLYYAKDELGDGDQPDGTPDKYQAVFEYVATTGGTITGITTEVVNVYDAAKFVAEGRDVSLLTAEDMAVKGVAVASGSKAENTNASVYEFSHWTLARKGHATFEIGVTTETLGSFQLPPVQGESLEAHWTVAGATYVFTAVYNEIPKPALLLDKLVARHENLPVGTKVEYVIHVHNAGNVDLTNIVVTDDLFYKNGEELTLIPNYIANIDNVRISGTTADNYEIGTAYSYIKILTLRADDTISIEYEYVIQPADAGKTIHNIAEATTTYNNETLFEEDSATITVAQKYYTVTYEDGWNGNAFAAKEYPGLVYGDATPIYQVTSLTYVNNGIKYLFAGWDEDPAGAMVAGDKTYTAQWDVEDVGFHVEHYLMENGVYGNNATYNHYHSTHKDGSDVLVGETVSYTDYVHHYVGYEVDKAEPASITISANEAENVIKIYYKTLHTVTYEDGVDGEEVFASQIARNLAYGDTTPAFNGTPERDGYYFAGWTPAVAPYVTGDIVYKATWGQKGGITITGASDTVIYNGTEQSVVGYSVTGLPEGYTLEDIAASDYVAKGTDAGTYAGSFNVQASDVIVRDASGRDVTAQYVVTLIPGTLTVNKRTVTLTSDSASRAYDGTALTAPNVTVGGDGFVSGEVTDVKATGTITNVGSVANTITYTEGAAFKADNYSITKTEGTLTVTADANEVIVTIVGNSETVTYDGQSHTVSGYTVTSSNGQYTENDFTFNGTATATGTDAGTYPMGLTASDFVNNNTNFNKVTFQVTDGTLTVNKRTVTLTSESASKAYDGTALTAPHVTVGGDGFVSGEVTDVKATGSVTNVGSVANTITYTEGAAFKADNYSITKAEGTLTVTAHSDDVVVTITEHSGSYQYDGTEKTVTGYDVTSIQIGGADTTLYTEADFEFTGTASVSGTAAGTYNMELKASDFVNKNANFDGKVTFVIVDGTLTITNADPKVTVKYVLKTLSGSTTEVASAPYDGQQANPFTVAYNGSYTIAVGTGSGNYVAPATITVDGKNYNYSSASGALTATGVTEDVTVTLVYEEEFVFIPVIRHGTLEISKQLDAPADFPANTRFTFNIYRISYYNGNKTYYDTVYLKAGETVTLRVEMGNYYVEEADASVDGYKLVVDCTDSDCTVQVNGGAKSSITFLNTYTELILELDDHFGYIIGYPDETVRPTQNITRAEVATIFFRMMTDTARAHYWSTENTFSDVSEDDWFNNAISTLQNAGVLDGYGDGTFRPNAYITRAELVKIAVSFYGTAAGKTSHFADVDAHWAEDFISAAEAIGFVDGYEDDTFKPDRLITRAETMKIVNRALGRKPHKNGLHKYMIEWVDNMDKTKWYYAEVQEATNSHEYEWEDTGFETWTAILPIRNWAALEKSWSEAHD